MPNYDFLLTAMIIWTTLWIDELMLESCDGNCVTVNKEADNYERVYLKNLVAINFARS
jgi:hypothetical protein